MIEHSFAQANFAQVDVVQAGQHRDPQHVGLDGVRGFNGSAQHLAASGGVHRQHTHAQLGRLADSCSDGVGDVVILEIEKDAASRPYQFADNRGTLGGVELHADFVGEGRVSDGRHDVPGGRGRGYIQGNDEALARFHILHRRCRVYRV